MYKHCPLVNYRSEWTNEGYILANLAIHFSNSTFFKIYIYIYTTAHRLTFALAPPVKRKYGFGGVMQGSVVIWQWPIVITLFIGGCIRYTLFRNISWHCLILIYNIALYCKIMRLPIHSHKVPAFAYTHITIGYKIVTKRNAVIFNSCRPLIIWFPPQQSCKKCWILGSGSGEINWKWGNIFEEIEENWEEKLMRGKNWGKEEKNEEHKEKMRKRPPKNEESKEKMRKY